MQYLWGKQIVDVLRSQTGLNISEFSQVIGEVTGETSNRQTLNNWRNRQDAYPLTRFMLSLCDQFLLSYNWALAGSGEQWNEDAQKMRSTLAKWHKEMPVQLTPAQRLAATWEKVRETIPEFTETVWATYLGCVVIADKGTDRESVRISDWYAIMHGHMEPGDLQFRGAAHVTGLPVEWFKTGEVSKNSPQ